MTISLSSLTHAPPTSASADAAAAPAAQGAAPTAEQVKAARDFEAIFMRQLLSGLEKAQGLGGGSSGGDVYRSMMVSALADSAAEGGGIGLSELILRAMMPPPGPVASGAGQVAPESAPAETAPVSTSIHVRSARTLGDGEGEP